MVCPPCLLLPIAALAGTAGLTAEQETARKFVILGLLSFSIIFIIYLLSKKKKCTLCKE